jgi:flagellar protein FliS
MLYDGAIKFLNQAKEYMAVNDVAKKGIAISKALDVINEMDSTLNMEKGGTLARNLHGLYLFCSNHLLRANLKKDPAMVDDVIRVLSGLRSAYSQILTMPEAQAAAQQAAANLRATAILPPRAQAGASTSGGEAPAPGANARIRALYAKQQTGAGETVPAAPEEAAGNTMAQPPEAPVANELPAQPQAEVEMPPPQVSGKGFSSRAHADLLRKLSAP